MDQDMLSRVSTSEAAEHDYFTTNSYPSDIAHTTELARDFVAKHLEEGRRICLITSGGTTVPLENQTVRFIDNFSAGTRGSTSAEYFLDHSYAVIFLHRKFSLLPYSRHYSHSTNCFLDFMDRDESGKVYVKEDYQRDMRDVLEKYQYAKDNGLLLLLPFTTIAEYLWSLRAVSHELRIMGSSAVLYLAAAVSDFFIPKDRLAEHKIQSSNPAGSQQQDASSRGGRLIIDLDPVPKFLKRVVDGWAPDAMVVSFKLETDPALLLSKAKGALEKYSHHMVIGNLLSTRSYEVVLVTPGKENWIRLPDRGRANSLTIPSSNLQKAPATTESCSQSSLNGSPPVEVEGLIIPEVIKLHDAVMNRGHEQLRRLVA